MIVLLARVKWRLTWTITKVINDLLHQNVCVVAYNIVMIHVITAISAKSANAKNV